MSVAELLQRGVNQLAASSDSARTDAALLLAHVLGRPRASLVAHGDAIVSDTDSAQFRALCNRRLSGEPIAYILGSASFYGREFLVNGSVLVPRPETEHLIDEALAFIRGPMRVLDVGTGSGAIACTIAAETLAMVDATDISPAAVDLARENARRLGVADRCAFYRGDLAKPVMNNRYDLVIANLPYIPTGDLPQPPDAASFEPRIALDGGADGLALYRRLLFQLPALVNDGAMVLLEAASPTIEKLAGTLRASLPRWTISIADDYAGLARYIGAIHSALATVPNRCC